jgi:hypothetical protein
MLLLKSTISDSNIIMTYIQQDACSGVHTSLKNEDMRAMSMM